MRHESTLSAAIEQAFNVLFTRKEDFIYNRSRNMSLLRFLLLF